MPKQQLKIIKTEYQQYRARLLRLKEMGVPIGAVHHPSPEPARLALEQMDHNSARLYELFSGMVAVVVPATIRVLSGTLITDVAVMIPRFDCPLELSDPAECKYYRDLIDGLPYNIPTKLLNNLLTSEIALRPCQPQGVIVAEGWTFVPPECPDELPVTMELFLRDERRNEFCFEFEVRLDRNLKRMYERRQRERHERIASTKGSGIFGPARGQLGDQKSVSPERATTLWDSIGEDDGKLRKPN